MSREFASLPMHGQAPLGQIHPTPNWSFTNLSERDAKIDFEITDVGSDCQVGNDTDGWTFYKVKKVVAGVAMWERCAGSGVSKTLFFGLRFWDSLDPDSFVLNELSFFTSSGLKIPVVFQADVGINTIDTPLTNISDDNTSTNFSLSNGVDPISYPIVIYGSAPGFYAEDVAYIKMYRDYTETNVPVTFDYVTSMDGSTWDFQTYLKNPYSSPGDTTIYNVETPLLAERAVLIDNWDGLWRSGNFYSMWDAATISGVTDGYLVGTSIMCDGTTAIPALRLQTVAHIAPSGGVVNRYQNVLMGTTLGSWELI